MGLGLKRICDACGAKFYDLEADPIICPKCGEVHDPETAGKPKRGRKKAVKKVDEKKLDKIEINIEDEDLELDDLEEVVAEEIHDDLELTDDEEVVREKAAPTNVLAGLEGDNDDIIDSGDDESSNP